ncbi:uncharacterized protein LOC5518726 [Nematostella vectensis]|uniref:uncharacterized protein LOC5518726 n=1 Tax=Nematostella vectensis TaxID=45351 RepID=UPI002076F914|nr:uncharacterized protein LOC5518726 [Nematostella vectensis]
MLTTGIRAVFLSTIKISAGRKMFSTSQRYSSSLRIDSYHIPILANGFAVVNSPYTLNIKPLDPSEYIEDEDFLMIVKEGQEMPSKASARVSLDLNIRDEMRRIHRQDFKQEFMKNISYDRRVVTRDQVQFLEVSCQPQAKYPFPVVDISLCLEIPVQFNMMIKASQYADVYVSNLEGGSFHEITTELGNCYLSSLKATDVHVKTKGGDIICPSYLLAEFGTLETEGQGKISVEKLQGRKFCMDSEAGGVHADSMYVSLGEVKTDAGPIKLGSIHGRFRVFVCGYSFDNIPTK